jgi:tRNA pseudouridine38-40 synthase
VKRYKIIIEYEGTDFVGWQRQDNGTSVQGLIEESIYNFSQEKVEVYGAGRTDAGVHALGQVAHFDLQKDIKTHKIRDAINHYLKPNLIAITQIEEVDSEFHARFSAKKRSYVYKILNRVPPAVLNKNKVWHVVKHLDIDNMQIAANHLVGKHDLTSFRSRHCQSSNPVKTIEEIRVVRDLDIVEIYISAPSFLHNQVRIIVGTLVKIGCGEWSLNKMEQAIKAKSRASAGPTAPPYGLYFLRVEY